MNIASSLRAVALAAACCCASFAAAAAPAYHLVDLGPGTTAGGINDHGAVAGASGGVAAVWHDSTWHLRPKGTVASGIDDQGEVIGIAALGPKGGLVPTYWPSSGAPIQVVTPYTPKNTLLRAVANGRVVGTGTSSDGAEHCFLWTPEGGAIDFGGGQGAGWCGASDVNDAGQVTGDMPPPGQPYPNAFVWQDGAMTFLGTLPGGQRSYGIAINRKGHVAMTSERLMASGRIAVHPALWNGTRVADLGVLEHGGSGMPTAMNDHDDVVGDAFGRGGVTQTSFLATGGEIYDLRSLIDNLEAGWTLYSPRGMADDGTLVGTADVGGVSHGYMLVPLAPLH
jgi:probable HAF family extracellular repeat protein